MPWTTRLAGLLVWTCTTRPPVEDTENDRRNPLVELPEPPEVVVAGIDAVLVTHMHRDHFDDTAAELLPKDVPVFCQPDDAERLRVVVDQVASLTDGRALALALAGSNDP